MIKKIVSGGQTGVDRAALDAAINSNFPHGGYCPKGRLAEDGLIPDTYKLIEAKTSDYAERTKLNVIHSDGTLILSRYQPEGGTAMTVEFAKRHAKPYLVFNPEDIEQVDDILTWANNYQIEVLNVAGPRASKDTGIYQLTFKLIARLLVLLSDT